MGKTSIQWTDRTWNPVRGCSRVSPGCVHCYAETMAARFSDPGQPFHVFAERKPQPHWTGKVALIEDKLREPLSWRKPCRVFVNSMSDLFHESLSVNDIARMFFVMRDCPAQQFQILTKRASNMMSVIAVLGEEYRASWPKWPLPNVWLGVSVEDRQRKDRIEWLRKTPASVRFLSLEPLLEDVGELDLTGIHQAIFGGESGPGARPCDVQWIRNGMWQCREQGVSCFVKQLGSHVRGELADFPHVDWATPGHGFGLKDRKGGDMEEWPTHLRVREFPGEAFKAQLRETLGHYVCDHDYCDLEECGCACHGEHADMVTA